MKQSTLLRGMSGEARLHQAFELSKFVREFSLMNIKSQLPKNTTHKQLRDALYKLIYGRTAGHTPNHHQEIKPA